MGRHQGDDTTGFQSPAQDYVESPIDLSQVLGWCEPGRYPVQFADANLHRLGIRAGDLLVTDAAAEQTDGLVCVAFVHAERMLAELLRRDGAWWCSGKGEVTTVTGFVAMPADLVRDLLSMMGLRTHAQTQPCP